MQTVDKGTQTLFRAQSYL